MDNERFIEFAEKEVMEFNNELEKKFQRTEFVGTNLPR